MCSNINGGGQYYCSNSELPAGNRTATRLVYFIFKRSRRRIINIMIVLVKNKRHCISVSPRFMYPPVPGNCHTQLRATRDLFLRVSAIKKSKIYEFVLAQYRINIHIRIGTHTKRFLNAKLLLPGCILIHNFKHTY